MQAFANLLSHVTILCVYETPQLWGHAVWYFSLAVNASIQCTTSEQAPNQTDWSLCVDWGK